MMRKTFALIISAVLLLGCLGISAMAAGTDDGSLTVATKDGKKYFGTEMSGGFVKYVAADGTDLYFYDLTEDKDMDICDLVALHIGEVDLDQNGSYTAEDAATLRLMLLGEAD